MIFTIAKLKKLREKLAPVKRHPQQISHGVIQD
jgi:hypothetical protein